MNKRVSCKICGRIYYKRNNRQLCPNCGGNKALKEAYDLDHWILIPGFKLLPYKGFGFNKYSGICKLLSKKDSKYYKPTMSYDKEYYERRRALGLSMPLKASNHFKTVHSEFYPKWQKGRLAAWESDTAREVTFFRINSNNEDVIDLIHKPFTIDRVDPIPHWKPKRPFTIISDLFKAYLDRPKGKYSLGIDKFGRYYFKFKETQDLPVIKNTFQLKQKGKKRRQVVDPSHFVKDKSESIVGVNCVPVEVATTIECYGKTVAKYFYGNDLVELYRPRKPRKKRTKIEATYNGKKIIDDDWKQTEVYNDKGECTIEWEFIPKVEKEDKTELTKEHNSRSRTSSYKYKPDAVYKEYKEKPTRWINGPDKLLYHATDSIPTHTPEYGDKERSRRILVKNPDKGNEDSFGFEETEYVDYNFGLRKVTHIDSFKDGSVRKEINPKKWKKERIYYATDRGMWKESIYNGDE